MLRHGQMHRRRQIHLQPKLVKVQFNTYIVACAVEEDDGGDEEDKGRDKKDKKERKEKKAKRDKK